MATIKFDNVKKELIQDAELKQEYDALEYEFNAIKALVDARNEAKLTQAQVTKRMVVTQSAVARIESGVWNIKYKTFLNYLRVRDKK